MCTGCTPSPDDDDESSEFYDAQSEETHLITADFALKIPTSSRRPSLPLNKPSQVCIKICNEICVAYLPCNMHIMFCVIHTLYIS